MRTISQKELKEILEKHKMWLNDEEGGETANLRHADLRGADLKFAILRGADLYDAYLRGADLRGADLKYADLREADLRGADLREADLQGADLRGADLKFAILRGADLRGADLQEADLKYADLRGADLRGADLKFAILRGADLRGADLQEADLQGADLRGARRPWFLYIGAIGSRNAETICFVDYDNILCGCWNNYQGGTLAEFKKRINEVYPADSENEEYQRYRLEYLSAIKMFESMREAYLKSVEEEKDNEVDNE